MKIAFILVSAICAISISVLSAVFVTQKIPFVVEEVEVEEPQPESSLSIFSNTGEAVAEMMKGLQAERESYAKKLTAIQEREETIKLQEEVLIKLKAEMNQLLEKMELNITQIETSAKAFQESEMENLVRLSDVYAKMDPGNAAKLLTEMEIERAAKILKIISERKAAAILDASVSQGDEGAASAAAWSEMLRKLKSIDTNADSGA